MYSIKALPFYSYETNEKDSLNWIPSESEKMILRSGGYKCECCGLESRPHRDFPSGYLELFKSNNVNQTLCSMCMQSQHLGRSVNGKSNHGLIIYCPNLSQGQIIKLAQWAFIAKLRGNRFASSANKMIGMITKDLVEPVSYKIPGFNSGDVQEFTDIYEHMSPKLKENSSSLLSDLKYWPNEVVFEPQVKFWNVAAFRSVSDDLEGLCHEDILVNSATA
jgi:hypothetical protein